MEVEKILGIAGFESIPAFYYSLIGNDFHDHKRYFSTCVYLDPKMKVEIDWLSDWNYSQNGPKSKRPQVRMAPIWSKRPHKLVKTARHPKNEGQNGPKSKRFHFFFFCKCIDKQMDNLVFRSRKYL